MRIRTVKPEFWDDETIAGLSRDARLLFIATFNLADDEGILRWTAEKLKALAFMYDDDVSVTRVAELMHELVTARLVAPYTHHGSLLAWVINFHRHQRVNRPQPSKFPAPSLQNAAVAVTYAERDHWTCHLCGGPVNRKPHRATDPFSPNGPPDISSLNASLDHLVPRVKGGSDYPSNIRLAHIGCNKSRRDKAITDFSPPASVTRALESLTSDDAPAVTVPDFFTEDSVNDPAPPTDHSPPEVEVEVEVEVEKSTSAPRKRGTRIDPSYRPSSELIAWARGESPGIDIRSVTEQFIDYWTAATGQKATKLDWDATWRTWVRNDKRYNGANRERQAPAHIWEAS